MNKKKLVRENFRTSVFTRDNYKCKICNSCADELDAHHITNRNRMPNGGYVKENGITLCPHCHIKAEKVCNGDYIKGYNAFNFYELINSTMSKAIEKSKLL